MGLRHRLVTFYDSLGTGVLKDMLPTPQCAGKYNVDFDVVENFSSTNLSWWFLTVFIEEILKILIICLLNLLSAYELRIKFI